VRLLVDVRVRGVHALRVRSDAAALGVTGPSGAGKSTLLRVLAGVERDLVGVVEAFGEPWLGPRSVPAWRRGVGWVPQDALLFPHLNVHENLGYSRGIVDDVVVDALGLAPLLDRSPRHLSGGEAQRVALGRAMCARPRLLLLDEPFSALDGPLRARVAGFVRAWCTQHGVAVVHVTHDERDLEGWGAEILVIRPPASDGAR
jgi:ABC-type sulfate/molybdate transport systems ATPase subunit